MSNVHQLVKELATYEQQRRDLEQDLNDLDNQIYNGDASLGSDEHQAYLDQLNYKKSLLEEQLDKVYQHIDDLEDDIDRTTNGNYGFDDDEY
jgi:predicted  nucleic acid-binding Zn-ribbon protein